MRFIADRFLVVLDANVLYPVGVADLLLRFSHAGLFRARWTEAITEEWVRSLIRNRPDLDPADIRRRADAMSRAFDDALVTDYEPLIETLDLPDPDDRHVLAAAIKAGAQHIVTANLADFPAGRLDPFGIEAIHPDDFLLNTFALYPEDAATVVARARKTLRSPPMSADEFLASLTRKGLPRFAAHLGEWGDLI